VCGISGTIFSPKNGTLNPQTTQPTASNLSWSCKFSNVKADTCLFTIQATSGGTTVGVQLSFTAS
jgi:hypothetical protein